jgi:excisionase family DNA binding protein
MAERTEQQQRVYFAVSGREVKIGLAKDPNGRVADMRIARAGIRLFGAIRGNRKLEKDLHERFSQERISGEWFRFTPKIQIEINELLRGNDSVSPDQPDPFRRFAPQELGDRYLITKDSIADRYSVSPRTIEFWVTKGRIPCVKVGRELLFNIADCDKAVDRFKRTVTKI